ncbi:MAG: metalloregulator ArsR/SmtB family transcription factor [bacterium]
MDCEGDVQNLLRIFKAAADPTRLRILRMLAVKPLCVCEVMSVLGMAQSTTSKHLRILYDAGLIEEIPGGVWTVYRFVRPQTRSVAAHLLDLIKKAEPTEQSKRDEEQARGADRERICRLRAEKTLKRQRRG